MKAYTKYKEWWMVFGVDHEEQLKSYSEQFEDHINQMTLYELMETLGGWDDD